MSDKQETEIEEPDSSVKERQDWNCTCGGEVVVWSSDPYYPDCVNCPDCGALMDRD